MYFAQLHLHERKVVFFLIHPSGCVRWRKGTNDLFHSVGRSPNSSSTSRKNIIFLTMFLFSMTVMFTSYMTIQHAVSLTDTDFSVSDHVKGLVPPYTEC